MGEDRGTIEDFYEPYLIQEGFLQRTPRGRVATRRAYEHLGYPAPAGHHRTCCSEAVRLPPMRRVALIYNPAAGQQAACAAGASRPCSTPCADGGARRRSCGRPAARGDATGLARAAAAEGFEAVFALGGDGTVREVAAGLLGSGVPLGVLPGGTVNLLARALGLPGDPLAAAALLRPAARPRRLDVGLAGATPFLMMVSAGLDASVLAQRSTHPQAPLRAAWRSSARACSNGGATPTASSS